MADECRVAGIAAGTSTAARKGLPAPLPGLANSASGRRSSSSTIADKGLPIAFARVLAVWDGSPSGGRDATAHLVAFARSSSGVDVEVLWPDGASRRG
ncbi:hypothetical protein PGH47_40990 [Streptomyces sp. HUAS 31]|uniref:hypothetical protein n=1 Tax=Streptomyces sp. HUAS 31 TaxID=3020055 RepID=UPI00230696A8|nr:hypothetical protein [Streptomyces sp. HUAS 31]WCE02373.1 hypothetical protein PGH47_40990 [Streptomyces sp. HUAS 31]